MQIKQEFYNGRTVWTVELRHWRTHGQEWIGKVTGTDEKYGLRLEFCDVLRRNWSRSGKNGITTFLLQGDGIYKYREPSTGGYERWQGVGYFELRDGTVTHLSEHEVYERLKASP